MSKNSMLFSEQLTDSFKRSQAMQFLMSQSLMGSLICGAVSLFMMVMVGSSIQYTIPFLILVFLAHSLSSLFFTMVYYYLYLLTIKDRKYKHVSYYVVGLFGCCVIGNYIALMVQNGGSIRQAGAMLLHSKLFYLVPVFGRIKMLLVSYVTDDIQLLWLGIVLLMGVCAYVH